MKVKQFLSLSKSHILTLILLITSSMYIGCGQSKVDITKQAGAGSSSLSPDALEAAKQQAKLAANAKAANDLLNGSAPCPKAATKEDIRDVLAALDQQYADTHTKLAGVDVPVNKSVNKPTKSDLIFSIMGGGSFGQRDSNGHVGVSVARIAEDSYLDSAIGGEVQGKGNHLMINLTAASSITDAHADLGSPEHRVVVDLFAFGNAGVNTTTTGGDYISGNGFVGPEAKIKFKNCTLHMGLGLGVAGTQSLINPVSSFLDPRDASLAVGPATGSVVSCIARDYFIFFGIDGVTNPFNESATRLDGQAVMAIYWRIQGIKGMGPPMVLGLKGTFDTALNIIKEAPVAGGSAIGMSPVGGISLILGAPPGILDPEFYPATNTNGTGR